MATANVSSTGSGEKVKLLDRVTKGDMHGVHYAVSIFIATAVLWVCVHELAEANPIWAISSMVATSDPLMKTALLTFRSRLINTLAGCAVGLLFIAIGGTRVLTLPLAMAVAVLLSTYVVRIPTMWRQGPITAAFVIAAGLEHHSRLKGLQAGMHRVSEVIFGCIVGLVAAWLVSVVWPLPDPVPANPPAAK
ncbi:MAG: FUSC family protein [Candidatus Korobacteraceae bacterium]